ncbi:hypothetical protein L228DRAFT_279281 [Xylona heveae TC161]|uniref:Uncharacterized protein n=1 Tax=Xylona heveae (strain CBS 132557 / TC161) TaxID=1328760 RepID=A0A165JBY3_XYLHT|nr:hypothetical protein L228DRAFT_279281 [Xylona heveae TC161]KZF26030.1 hypothetical protein L228DRAFT_279281 [Xylona heveae TC161]
MTCLCSKLRSCSYDTITPDECTLLNETYRIAPSLFRKDTRQERLEILSKSYPDTEFEFFWKNVRQPQEYLKEQLAKDNLLSCPQTDTIVHVYLAITSLEPNLVIRQIMKRIYCLALSRKYPIRTSHTASVSRILQLPGNLDPKSVSNKFKKLVCYGRRWEWIVRKFAGETGMLCLLGKNWVVLNQLQLLRGKIFRYQGHFQAALVQFKQLFQEVENHGDLYFDIRRELFCNLADALCESDKGEEAERILTGELARPYDGYSSRDVSELKLSLVEALLQQGQGRLAEAQNILDGHPWGKLPRAAQLRLLTLQARIHHSQAQYAEAKAKWSEALDYVQKFPLGHGHASRAILSSLADSLLNMGDLEFGKLSIEQGKVMATEGGCRFWIAGLGSYWLDWVKTRGAEHALRSK